MQIPSLWKRITGIAGGLGAILAAVIAWQQLEFGRPAWSSDVKELDGKLGIAVETLTKRIDGLDRVILFRERDRVEDRIDELYERQRQEPHNTALRRLIKLRERERDEIDRQIDELQ